MEKKFSYLQKDYRGLLVFIKDGAVICTAKNDFQDLIDKAWAKGYDPMGTEIILVD